MVKLRSSTFILLSVLVFVGTCVIVAVWGISDIPSAVGVAGVLVALRDCVHDLNILHSFRSEPAFEVSLLRTVTETAISTSFRRALRDQVAKQDGDYDATVKIFGNQLGNEARAVARALSKRQK